MSNENYSSTVSPYGTMADGIIGRNTSITNTNMIRPIYYGGETNTYEVFKVLEAWGLDKDFYLGNVIKYIVRAGKKNPGKYKEDLEKAIVYLQKRIDSLDK